MGIYVNGMDMPKSCFYCPFRRKINPDDIQCLVTRDVFEETFAGTIEMRKREFCPLIEIPPHGRLIDADELMLRIQEYIDEYGWDVDEHGFHSEKWCAMKETEMAINDAPTVIPADKDGET